MRLTKTLAAIPSALERTIASISPAWAAARAHHRAVLAYYEATKTTRLRPDRRKDGTGDQVVAMSAAKLRAHARYLERNYDIARGILSRLVENIVGADGIQIEPQPRNRDGEIHDDLVKDIQSLLRDWERWPDVTWERDWASTQRLLCRGWVRDGDAFAQHLLGSIPGLTHGSDIPYSLELLESDDIPIDFYDEGRSIVQGVERNSWGRSAAYWVYKTDPSTLNRFISIADLKRVPAERMLCVKLVDRVRQARGVSIFASILTRLDDIKDYEESERIAAKVAASMAAYIKKGIPEDYQSGMVPTDSEGNPMPRNLRFRPGMVFDDLRPGEEIGTIDTRRPNPNTENFRKGQLRAAAAGASVSYSSAARDYNGTFSSQRQELVEQWGAYEVLSDEFAAGCVQPVYLSFLSAAISSGLLKLPKDLDPRTLDDAIYVPPQMPWIDPLKEALAWGELEARGYASGPEICRRRGLNPRDVIEQEARWQRLRKERGLDTPPAQSRDAALALLKLTEERETA